MVARHRSLYTALASATLLTLAACGGSSSNGPAPSVAPTSTNVSTSVVDGAIGNALVCVDKNGNGLCDTDETQGRTNTDGNVTLAVPNADVGRFPVVAMVGTDAVDKDHGPVTTAYKLWAPADQVAVVSPLTTLVQHTIAGSGGTTPEAAKAVQDIIGVDVPLFADYTKVAAPTDGSLGAATLARMVVVTMQQQTAAIDKARDTKAIDGAPITQTDLDTALQRKLLEMLPALVTALADPAVAAAATPDTKEAAIAAAATRLIAGNGLTLDSMATVVAANRHLVPEPALAASAAPSMQLMNLNFTDAANYNLRLLTGSTAQNTPDSSNAVRFVDRRLHSVGGNLAAWGSGSDPWRNADLSWNGSAWVACPINYENVASVRDAAGANTYTYCDRRETGRSSRAVVDIAGKAMADVYAQVLVARYTNLAITNPTALGSATFPAGSSLLLQTTTPLTEAISYYPAGVANPAGYSNVVSQYSAAVSAGGTASGQAAGTACNNSAETALSPGFYSKTLDAMIAAMSGTPCVYGPASVTYNGVTYPGDADSAAWWGNSTVSLGTIGTVSTTPTVASTGYATGNVLLRVAFSGSGTNPVTYYACQQRYVNGSTRGCKPIGTGAYTIATLGDARVMTLANPPAQAAALNYQRVFVERGGQVYYGYQSKPIANSSARLNTVAAAALLAQLGVPAQDPSVPLALTTGSYQGTWDMRAASSAVSPTNGTTVSINANGSVSCFDRASSTSSACTVTITDPASGAFSFSGSGGNTASGILDFATGTASGVFNDPTSTPPSGTFVGGRR